MATDTFTAFTACSELGLAPGASEREAKAAWRRLVSQWHPDRNPGPGAVGRMQRLNQALEALRRAGFPGHSGPAQPAAPPAPPTAADPPAAGAGSDTSDTSDTSGSSGPTGQPGQPGQPGQSGQSGRSLRRQVRLTLDEAALGCTRVLTGKGSRVCASCSGAGWLRAGGDCATCHGAGALRQPGWFGLFGHASACAACGGSGQARQPCLPCAGSGQRSQPGYRVSVRLPAGVRDGDLLTVAAHRMPQTGQMGQMGDLQIRVRVQPHPLLMLDDDGTLRCSLTVSGWAWMANRTVQMPGLGGPLPLLLDRTLRCHRLVGAGFPVSRGGPRGDLLVSVLPQFPAQLSTDQHILIDQLVASGVSAG